MNAGGDTLAVDGFAAALIAGGQSTRMGRDKAWLDWQGEPLWQVQLAKLAALSPALLMIASREEQRLVAEGTVLVTDPPGNEGPLPALARCLERAQLPVLALAVDMPRVNVPMLREILRRGNGTGCGVIFRGAHGYEPLCALYPPAVLRLLRESLAQDNRRMQAFVQCAVDAGLLRVIPLSKEQEALCFNLNSPADLA